MSRNKYFVLLVLGLVLMLAASFVACESPYKRFLLKMDPRNIAAS